MKERKKERKGKGKGERERKTKKSFKKEIKINLKSEWDGTKDAGKIKRSKNKFDGRKSRILKKKKLFFYFITLNQ